MGHYMFNHLRLPVLVAFGGFAIFTLSLFGSISIQKSAGRCFFFYTRPFSIEKKSASIANIIFAMIFMQRYFCNDIEQHLFQTNGKHSK